MSAVQKFAPALFSARGDHALVPPPTPLLHYPPFLLSGLLGRDAANMESLGAQHSSLVEQAVLLVQVKCICATPDEEAPGKRIKGPPCLTRSPCAWFYRDLLLY